MIMGIITNLFTLMVSELPAPVLVLEVVSKGTVVLLLALGLCSLLRRSPATARHAVIVSAICANLVLPVLVTTMPAWDPPRPLALSSNLPINPQILRSPVDTRNTPEPHQDPVLRTSVATTPKPRPAHWLGWLWLAGAALVALRFVVGLIVVRRILRDARPVTCAPALAQAQSCRRQLGLNREVVVLVSGRAAVAFTRGWLRPRVVLPAESTTWTPQKMRIVLLHEMAHVKRWDALATSLAQLAVIVYWFNPLLWAARRRLLVDRERASDDLVLSTGIQASTYAACLLEIACALRGKRWLPELQIVAARKLQLEERIVAILKGNGRRGLSSRRRSTRRFLTVASLLALMIPLASWRIFAQNAAATVTETRPSFQTGEMLTEAERHEIEEFLDRFYTALGDGEDLETIQERFLASDYFSEPSRTFEQWPQERRERYMLNTLRLLPRLCCGQEINDKEKIRRLRAAPGVAIAPENPFGIDCTTEVVSCRKLGGEYALEQKVTIKARGIADCPQTLVEDLVHTMVFTRENDGLKIRSCDGGIGIRRMGVNNPYGPVLIVTVDEDGQHAPAGPMLFKSIPRSVVENAVNIVPLCACAPDL